jgi:hypothetical protein
MGEESKGSWFASLPGVLTAVATLVTALTAGYAAYKKSNPDSPPQQIVAKPADSSSAATPPSSTAPVVTPQGTAAVANASCRIDGFIYNQATNKALPGVQVSIDDGTSNGRVIATSGPLGKFVASCGDLPASAFPLRLKITSDSWKCGPAAPPVIRPVAEEITSAGSARLTIPVPLQMIMRAKARSCRG